MENIMGNPLSLRNLGHTCADNILFSASSTSATKTALCSPPVALDEHIARSCHVGAPWIWAWLLCVGFTSPHAAVPGFHALHFCDSVDCYGFWLPVEEVHRRTAGSWALPSSLTAAEERLGVNLPVDDVAVKTLLATFFAAPELKAVVTHRNKPESIVK